MCFRAGNYRCRIFLVLLCLPSLVIVWFHEERSLTQITSKLFSLKKFASEYIGIGHLFFEVNGSNVYVLHDLSAQFDETEKDLKEFNVLDALVRDGYYPVLLSSLRRHGRRSRSTEAPGNKNNKWRSATTTGRVTSKATTDKSYKLTASTKSSLNSNATTNDSLTFNATFNGSLPYNATISRTQNLKASTNGSLNFNTTTNRSLNANATTNGSQNFNTTTNGSLDINATTNGRLNFNTTTNRSLNANTTTNGNLIFNATVLSRFNRTSAVSVHNNSKPDPILVPNVVHYVILGTDLSFTFINFLSFLSVERFMKPTHIMIYGDVVPKGQWWNLTVEHVKNIYHVRWKYKHAAPNGQNYKYPAHISDYIRTEVLVRYGGIYIDADVLVVKSFDRLRQYPVVFGRETPEGICNGIIIAKRGAIFLRLLLEQYRSYLGKNEIWAVKSVVNVHKLMTLYPHLIHVEETSLNRPNWVERAHIYGGFYNWTNNYAVHLWVRLWPPHIRPSGFTSILIQNTTFGLLSRLILFGSTEVVPKFNASTDLDHIYADNADN